LAKIEEKSDHNIDPCLDPDRKKFSMQKSEKKLAAKVKVGNDVRSKQCDRIGRNFAVLVHFFPLGALFFL
jgi:hypothetical protein